MFSHGFGDVPRMLSLLKEKIYEFKFKKKHERIGRWKTTMRLIIAGSRDFEDYKLVRDSMNKIFVDRDTVGLTILSGGCAGADRLGEKLASVNGIPLH